MKNTNTSIAVTCLGRTYRSYLNLESAIGRIYQNSYIHRLSRSIWETAKTNFRYSLLGRITNINDRPGPDILGNSIFANRMLKRYSRLTKKAGSALKDSRLMNYTLSLKRELYHYPLRSGGMISVTSISVNVIISLFLQKEISWFGWMMRGLFFSLGMICLFSYISWKELEGTSRFLAYLKPKESK